MRPYQITLLAWVLALIDSTQYARTTGLEAALWAGLCGASVTVMILGAWEVSND